MGSEGTTCEIQDTVLLQPDAALLCRGQRPDIAGEFIPDIIECAGSLTARHGAGSSRVYGRLIRLQVLHRDYSVIPHRLSYL